MGVTGTGTAPVLRTCLACRNVLPKSGLLRVALKEGRLMVDLNNRAGGRGAYICADMECLEKVRKKKGAFGRAFRQSVTEKNIEDFFLEISGLLHAPSGSECS